MMADQKVKQRAEDEGIEKEALQPAAKGGKLRAQPVVKSRRSFYEVGGKRFARVTGILGTLDKPALVGWAANTAIDYLHRQWANQGLHDHSFEIARTAWRAESKKAMDIGSEVHKLIEIHIKEGVDPTADGRELKDEVAAAYLAFLDWEKNNIKEWKISEGYVFSEKHRFAGTRDAEAIMLADPDAKVPQRAGKLYLIDFKSSKGIYDEAYLQVAGAYWMAREEMRSLRYIPNEPLEGIGILRLDKLTGIPEFVDATDFQAESQEAFLKLVAFYHAKKEFDQVKPDWRKR